MIDERKIATLLLEYPRLHLYGVGPHPSIDIEPATYAELLTPSSRVRTAAALTWIEANLVPAPRGNRKQARSTYTLKHQLQRDTGLYVYNGEMAAAALLSHISVDAENWFNPLVFATLSARAAQQIGGDDVGKTNNTRR